MLLWRCEIHRNVKGDLGLGQWLKCGEILLPTSSGLLLSCTLSHLNSLSGCCSFKFKEQNDMLYRGMFASFKYQWLLNTFFKYLNRVVFCDILMCFCIMNNLSHSIPNSSTWKAQDKSQTPYDLTSWSFSSASREWNVKMLKSKITVDNTLYLAVQHCLSA